MSQNILLSGVSKGLGLCIAETLLKSGDCVYGIARSETSDLIKLQARYPDQLFFKSVDLSVVEAVGPAVFGDFISSDVALHGWVNNAAMAYDDLLTNMQFEALEQMYRVNVLAPLLLTKSAVRNMLLHSVPGSIVHVSSISVHTGYKGLSMYASTKGALEAFSKNAAREWGARGIRSNCVVAGFMETEMSLSLSDAQRERIYQRTALQQATQLQSVADTVNFLLSAQSASITGQNIHVDSGTI